MPYLSPQKLLHLNNPKLQISFDEHVLTHFAAHRQDSFWKTEAGGQLFAKIEGCRWHIVKVNGPRRSDYRRRFRFLPKRTEEQSEIETAFGAGFHYVGDWHTHPEAEPTPSNIDTASMTELVRLSKHELPGFVMVIVGADVSPNGLWVSFHAHDGTTVNISSNYAFVLPEE